MRVRSQPALLRPPRRGAQGREVVQQVSYEARALALTGRGEECLDLELGVYDPVRALCLHSMGRHDEAERLAVATAGRITSGDRGTTEYMADLFAQDLASYYALTGNPEEALRWIRWAFDLSPSGVDERLLGSELFEPVRSAPGFADQVALIRTEARARVADMRNRMDALL